MESNRRGGETASTEHVDQQAVNSACSTKRGGSSQQKQLWKVHDDLAQKSGNRHAVFWVNKKRGQQGSGNSSDDYEKGTTYQGEWEGDHKHGYGIQIWPNGNKYEGDWVHGKRQGHGVYWVNTAASSNGKKKSKPKLRKVYAGNWLAGEKSGLGVYFYKQGDRYEGEWLRNLRHGNGTMFYRNGDIYVGSWYEGMRSGFGTLTQANKNVYEGQWLNDKKEGPGIFYYQEQEKIYDGEWVQGTPKCGVYMDAEAFFNQEDDDSSDDEDEIKLPELQLQDPESVLSDRIEKIQAARNTVRALPETDLESVFTPDDLDTLREVFSGEDDGTGRVLCSSLGGLLQDVGFSTTEAVLAGIVKDLALKKRRFLRKRQETGDHGQPQFAAEEGASSASTPLTLSFVDFVKAVHIVREQQLLQT